MSLNVFFIALLSSQEKCQNPFRFGFCWLHMTVFTFFSLKYSHPHQVNSKLSVAGTLPIFCSFLFDKSKISEPLSQSVDELYQTRYTDTFILLNSSCGL